jgi:acyl-coenzyme A thioesterase PaaI-like protein
MPESFNKEALKRYFEKDRFARYVGIELLEISSGRATAVLKIKEHHLNAVEMVHGGPAPRSRLQEKREDRCLG